MANDPSGLEYDGADEPTRILMVQIESLVQEIESNDIDMEEYGGDPFRICQANPEPYFREEYIPTHSATLWQFLAFRASALLCDCAIINREATLAGTVIQLERFDQFYGAFCNLRAELFYKGGKPHWARPPEMRVADSNYCQRWAVAAEWLYTIRFRRMSAALAAS
jgi:hypothetical protein